MNEEIRSLIESLRRGDSADPTEKISLLAAALREHQATAETILDLLKAQQIPLRLAGLEATQSRTDQILLDALAEMTKDPVPRVRAGLAHTLRFVNHPAHSKLLTSLMEDDDARVRFLAVQTSSGQSSFFDLQRVLLEKDPDCDVREVAAEAIGAQKKSARVVPILFEALISDEDYDVQMKCAENLEKRMDPSLQSIEKYLPKDIAPLSKARATITELGIQRFQKIAEWINHHTADTINPAELTQFGTDLTALAQAGNLPRGHGLEGLCQSLLAKLSESTRGSLVLLGETGTGKTALVHELVHQLGQHKQGGWRVLRISPSEFLVGTTYLGDWETKLKKLINIVRKPKRVILYVPNLSKLSDAGRHSKSDANVAGALAPYLEDGSIVILGESTPEEYDRGLGALPALRRLFEPVLIKEASLETTRSLLNNLCEEAQCPAEETVLDQILELGTQFLNHIHRPGNAVSLLRACLGRRQTLSPTEPLSVQHALEALQQSTGIPSQLLDDSVGLNLQEVRTFFENRIMGQPEAVEAVVDLVALIKAGLSDPNKPFAVLLFVGPTGVGKTELARGLAEFIFGDPARLKRFDMSEYASFEGFERLIGNRERSGTLTDAVRRQPFSVVLLDEIEKSHINVFDLCLQIFDAGRLTDGQGRVVDFRRTVVILTSNIGASAPSPNLGFHTAGASSNSWEIAEPDADKTFRQLSQFFRPEFLNRLDRILSFRALSLEVAEQIARRELDLVLQRSGITRRQLVVDLDPAIISLLVKEGYSPHFGARPIKRIVQQLCLMPLAKAIATGRINDRSVLQLGLSNGKIQVRIHRAPSPPASPSRAKPELESLQVCAQRLIKKLASLQASVNPMAERKSELLQKTRAPGFYDQPELKSKTFDEIHKLEQFLTQFMGLEKAVIGLEERLANHTVKPAEESSLRDRCGQLDNELQHLQFIVHCQDANDLSDALICVSRIDQKGDPIEGVEKIARMYLGLARQQRLEADVLGEYTSEKTDLAYLQVCGLGAHALLKHESGLHQFTRRQRYRDPRNGREKTRQDREIVRVRILPFRSEPDKSFLQSLKENVKPLKPAHNRLIPKANLAVTLFHQPTLRSLEIWAQGPREHALNQSRLILHTETNVNDSDDSSQENDTSMVVRQYRFGLAPMVKDTRSGRSSSQVDKVLQGRLDPFLNVSV